MPPKRGGGGRGGTSGESSVETGGENGPKEYQKFIICPNKECGNRYIGRNTDTHCKSCNEMLRKPRKKKREDVPEGVGSEGPAGGSTDGSSGGTRGGKGPKEYQKYIICPNKECGDRYIGRNTDTHCKSCNEMLRKPRKKKGEDVPEGAQEPEEPSEPTTGRGRGRGRGKGRGRGGRGGKKSCRRSQSRSRKRSRSRH